MALEARRATWASNAPGVALVIEGRLQAGDAAGTATITAESGGQRAQARVVVANARAASHTITPRAPSLRIGEVVTFGLEGLGVRPSLSWTARNPRVLHQAGPSTFLARSAGKSPVCVSIGSSTVCTDVTVRN